MLFKIDDISVANITFNGNAKVTILSDSTFFVKWFNDNVFVGEMEIFSGCWGLFPLSLGNWKIQFWSSGNLVNTYENNLRNEKILFVAKFSTQPGKKPPVEKLIQRLEDIQKTYGCQTVCYFDKSEEFFLPSSIIPLRMNDDHEFKLMMEEWIA
jgi:hypothetical protein